jgi:hypothetical protein
MVCFLSQRVSLILDKFDIFPHFGMSQEFLDCIEAPTHFFFSDESMDLPMAIVFAYVNPLAHFHPGKHLLKPFVFVLRFGDKVVECQEIYSTT